MSYLSDYSPKKYLLDRLRQRPRSRIARRLASYATTLNLALKNLSYDPLTNGEAWIIESLESLSKANLIFDVGANTGGWSVLARNRAPNSAIFCFEIAPETFQLLERMCVDPRTQLFNVGLGEHSETRKLEYIEGSNTLSTLVDGFSESYHRAVPKLIEVQIVKGDDFCVANNIERIDFLKIDVEGFEPQVLQGFDVMIRSEKIPVIQFEYGRINIATRFLLIDFYSHLEERGYVIGKVYPDHVAFKSYQYADEDFLGPNYLAVLKKENELIKMLTAGRQ